MVLDGFGVCLICFLGFCAWFFLWFFMFSFGGSKAQKATVVVFWGS